MKQIRYAVDSPTLYVLVAKLRDMEWRMLFQNEQEYRNEANQFMKMGWECSLYMATTEFICDFIVANAPLVKI